MTRLAAVVYALNILAADKSKTRIVYHMLFCFCDLGTVGGHKETRRIVAFFYLKKKVRKSVSKIFGSECCTDRRRHTEGVDR